MKYINFRDLIQNELIKHPDGFTWKQLKKRLDLPYDRPCQTWVNRLEQDIGLLRERDQGRALTWKIGQHSK